MYSPSQIYLFSLLYKINLDLSSFFLSVRLILACVCAATPLSIMLKETLKDTGIMNAMPTKQQFNSATGGLISIDDDDDVLFETSSTSRMWNVYTGQLQGTEPAPELVKQTVRSSGLLTAAVSGLFWFWALSNIVNKVTGCT